MRLYIDSQGVYWFGSPEGVIQLAPSASDMLAGLIKAFKDTALAAFQSGQGDVVQADLLRITDALWSQAALTDPDTIEGLRHAS